MKYQCFVIEIKTQYTRAAKMQLPNLVRETDRLPRASVSPNPFVADQYTLACRGQSCAYACIRPVRLTVIAQWILENQLGRLVKVLRIVAVAEGLYFIDCTGPLDRGLRQVQSGSRHSYKCRARDVGEPALPVSPVTLITNEETDEHARIHVIEVESSNLSGMAGLDFNLTHLGGILVIWQCRTSEMRVQVNKIAALCADKIVRGRWSSP